MTIVSVPKRRTGFVSRLIRLLSAPFRDLDDHAMRVQDARRKARETRRVRRRR